METHLDCEIEKKCPDIASSTDDYATRFSGAIGGWFLDVQNGATLRYLAPYQGRSASIIDVGGGHGQNVGAVLSAGHRIEVTGSDESCKHRLQHFLETDDRSKFTICPLTEIPAGDQAYDAVVSYRMLSHLDHWPEFVAELCRVSKERVIVDYPTYRSVNLLNSALFVFKKGVEKNTRKFLIFHEKKIVKEFRKHGFVQKGRVGQFTFPMALHRMHKTVPLAKLIEGVCRLTGLSWMFGSPVISCFEREVGS